MKWGDKYSPEYVNKLYAMVDRNLSLSFRFICFTENPQGLNDKVEVAPLPSLDLPEGMPERGWLKLATFNSPLFDLQGPTLFLDLDVVIVDSIDPFFEIEGEFFIAFDEKKRKEKIGNSSVYRFEAGKHESVLSFFRNNFSEVVKSVRNEQAYLSHKMEEKGILKFWPKDWCPSFKYHCVPKFPLNFFKEPAIPNGARIILFHGLPEPEDASKGVSGKWYRFIKPTKWINTFWNV